MAYTRDALIDIIETQDMVVVKQGIDSEYCRFDIYQSDAMIQLYDGDGKMKREEWEKFIDNFSDHHNVYH
jgi:hypothetical protein